jgi:hypothetical protein
MSETVQKSKTQSFQLLEKVFWVIWVLMPFLFYKLWKLVNDPATYMQGLTPDQVKCMSGIINPAQFSSWGTLIYNLPLIATFIFYVILIFNFHRMVRRFAAGGAFDAFTLRDMKTLGITLIVYPFFDFALGHFVSAALQYTGELKTASEPSFVDIGVVAAGFFIIALMIVLKNAIDLKSENDLTI